MNIIEKAQVKHYHRQRLGKEQSYEQGYRSPKSQTQRFKALSQWGDLTGLTILDLGCGYGDLKTFLDQRFESFVYLGVDFFPEFIDGANQRFSNTADTHFIRADFARTELPEVDLVIACGSLNYCSQNTKHPWYIIEKMWHAARKGIAFNLLDKKAFDDGGLLCAYESSKVYGVCQKLSQNIKIKRGYLPDDFTVFMYR